MSSVLPFRPVRRRRPPRIPGAPPDRHRVLSVVPARPGWRAWSLAYDKWTIAGERIFIWWSEPIAAWGEVEWTWGRVPEGMPTVERIWEALVADSEAGFLDVPTSHASNVFSVIVTGPRENPPEWARGTVHGELLRRELWAEHLKYAPSED